jgi:hypothetical protein
VSAGVVVSERASGPPTPRPAYSVRRWLRSSAGEAGSRAYQRHRQVPRGQPGDVVPVPCRRAARPRAGYGQRQNCPDGRRQSKAFRSNSAFGRRLQLEQQRRQPAGVPTPSLLPTPPRRAVDLYRRPALCSVRSLPPNTPDLRQSSAARAVGSHARSIHRRRPRPSRDRRQCLPYAAGP